MRVLLLTPPTTQLNTPYPATAYLARFLGGLGHQVHQRDLGIALMQHVFSRSGMAAVFAAVEQRAEAEGLPEPAWAALAQADRIQAVIEPVVRFLQGTDPTLANRIVRPGYLPSGPRLDRSDTDAFGRMGLLDAARYRATLFIEDLADLVTATVDLGFGLARYQHHLATGPVSFDPIAARLEECNAIDAMLDALADALLPLQPDLVGITVPFPGTLVGALRLGRRLKAAGLPVVMGGGYISTELREVDEPRLWSCTDALVYDDGEGPLQAILEHLAGGPDRRHRTRTAAGLLDAPAPRPQSLPVADYGDLPLGAYLQVLDTLNPAHRLWSDGRWNKATLAHGCYWRRCAFCDVKLDYVARFEPSRVGAFVDAIADLVARTGQTGLHLVDEAAPPRLMRDLALELLRRELDLTWWGNIRFERAFTPDLCRLLAASGLVGVTGGLEVASDRLLRLMDKGITVEQAARACAALGEAGVMVHAYLMYGFPTQSAQETVDSAEVVRQLFAAGLLDSAFWHRFVLTRHSGVYADPARFGVEFDRPTGVFATNDLPHRDPTGADPDAFDGPLVQMLAAWMQGLEQTRPVHRWFDKGAVPRAQEPADRIAKALRAKAPEPAPNARLIWLGGGALDGERGLVLFDETGDPVELTGPPAVLRWVADLVAACRPTAKAAVLQNEALAGFPGDLKRWNAQWGRLRRAGLVAV